MSAWQSILWAAPVVIVASILMGWAAETAQLYISQGLALAFLAWLQVSPEFAVEAVIAWEQKQSLMIANLTGSLRLLVGFGWPLIYFTKTFFSKEKRWSKLCLNWVNGLEVLTLLLSTLYFGLIWLKGSLTIIDSFFLGAIYTLYLYELTKLPKGIKEEEADLPWVGKKISSMEKTRRWPSLLFLFVLSGFLLSISTRPFLLGLEALALTMGIPSFYFVQWCAPFVSEFPEKVTAFQWARTSKKAPMAMINMISSNIVQWTLMAGMIPIVLSLSKKEITPLIFSPLQLQEIGLTLMQSLLSLLFLMDLEINVWEALGLFSLWGFQFFYPSGREFAMILYGVGILAEVILLALKKKLFYALVEYRRNKNK